MGKFLLQEGEYSKEFFIETFAETLKDNYEDTAVDSNFLVFGLCFDGVVKHTESGKKFRITSWKNLANIKEDKVSVKEIAE